MKQIEFNIKKFRKVHKISGRKLGLLLGQERRAIYNAEQAGTVNAKMLMAIMAFEPTLEKKGYAETLKLVLEKRDQLSKKYC